MVIVSSMSRIRRRNDSAVLAMGVGTAAESAPGAQRLPHL